MSQSEHLISQASQAIGYHKHFNWVAILNGTV